VGAALAEPAAGFVLEVEVLAEVVPDLPAAVVVVIAVADADLPVEDTVDDPHAAIAAADSAAPTSVANSEYLEDRKRRKPKAPFALNSVPEFGHCLAAT
jgi:hypothetical protein